MYDLIVIGGGPAGTICAREAALSGLSVMIIEKEKLPRNKLCGGALSPRVSELLDFDISSVVQREMKNAVIYAPSGRKIVVTKTDSKGNLIKRSDFDHLLVQKAKEAGVQVLESTRVLSIEQVRTGVRILTHGDSYKTHILVGADGVNSLCARQLGIRRTWPSNRVALCIAADIPLPPEEIDRIMSIEGKPGQVAIEMYLWAMDYGYGWCFPKHDEISLGIGYKMKHGVVDLRSAWKQFVDRFEKEKGIKLDTSGQSAHRVPLGKMGKRITSRRTMLVGDAAGLVSPITGEGIFYALQSGIIAGRVASEAVKKKDPLLVRIYEHRLKKALKTEFSAANFVSNLVFRSEKNVELVCELAEKDPILRDQIVDLGIGARPISKIRMEITKRMLRHHPVKGLRLFR